MPIIKKLIIKEWLRYFLGTFTILLLILTIANLISGLLRGNVSFSDVLINHLIQLPSHLNKIIPVSCLGASLFSTNQFLNRNELTAIFSSGFTRKKYLLTLIQIALFIATSQFLINGYLSPYMTKVGKSLITNAEKKFGNLRKKGIRSSITKHGKMWFKSKTYIFSFSVFDIKNKTLKDVTYYYFKNKKISKVIYATTATHESENRWNLLDVEIYSKLSEEGIPHTETRDKINIQLSETPLDFQEIESDINTLYFDHLYQYIKRLNKSGINTDKYNVMLYDKVATAVISLIFTLIAAIGIFNPNRKSSSFGKNIAFILVFILCYWLIYSYSLELGNSSVINPILATSFVPITFLSYLSYFIFKHRKLPK